MSGRQSSTGSAPESSTKPKVPVRRVGVVRKPVQSAAGSGSDRSSGDSAKTSSPKATETTPKPKVPVRRPTRPAPKKPAEEVVEPPQEEGIADAGDDSQRKIAQDLSHLAIKGRKLDPSKFRTEVAFQKKDAKAQMRISPDMWIGSCEQSVRDIRVMRLGSSDPSLTMDTTTLPEAVERLFQEPLYNAGDNANYSIFAGIRPGIIKVTMTKTRITIENSGANIPVVKDSDGKWIPEVMFGEVFAGTHFDNEIQKFKELSQGGKNGVGAKGTNVFSTEFLVEINDPVNNLSFRQTWSKGEITGPATVKKPTRKVTETMIRVSYVLDFEYFKMACYDYQAFGIFSALCADISVTAKVPVKFVYDLEDGPKTGSGRSSDSARSTSSTDSNRIEPFTGSSNPRVISMNYQDIRDYAKLYLGGIITCESLVHYELPEGESDEDRRYYSKVRDRPKDVLRGIYDYRLTPQAEILVLDSPDPFIVSLANGVLTKEGGLHVIEATRAAFQQVLSDTNGNKLGKGAGHVELKDLRSHVSLIVIARVHRPVYGGQCKEVLKGPKGLKYVIPDKVTKDMLKWPNLAETLDLLRNQKQAKLIRRPSAKSSVQIFGRNIEDAIEARDKKNSKHCTLILTEGLSAMGYAYKYVSMTPEGRRRYGIMALRGKPINPDKQTPDKVEANRELELLITVLGLRLGVEDYSTDQAFGTLRYGRLLIMADSDVDGLHIIGLLINLFKCCFPSLLKRPGFVSYWRTPFLRMTKNRKTVKFYSLAEYEDWIRRGGSDKGYTSRYFKGLGSSGKPDIADDYRDPHNVVLNHDDRAAEAIELAFSPKTVAERKVWLETGLGEYLPGDQKVQGISHFISSDFKAHPIDNTHRTIVSAMDGFKEVIRKAFFNGIHTWGYKGACKPGDLERVIEFAGGTSKLTSYHHGEASLCAAIIGVTQDYVGSNNLTLFDSSNGEFGSRNRGIEDAADPRYPSIGPNWFWPYIWREEDRVISQRRLEQGKTIEFETFYPVICWALVNGSRGIGTAYSSFIPSFNPEDIAIWLYLRVGGVKARDIPIISPWVRGYKTKIAAERVGNADRVQDRDRFGATDAATKKVLASANEHLLDSVGAVKTKRETKRTTALDIDEVLDKAMAKSRRLLDEADSIEDDDDVRNRYLSSIRADLAMSSAYEDIADRVGEESEGSLRMVVEGCHETVKPGHIRITEIPLITIQKYCQHLQNLVKNGFITSYENDSRDCNVKIDIFFPPGQAGTLGGPGVIIDKHLALKRTFGMGNMIALDDKGFPIRFQTPTDLLEYFFEKRLLAYARRKRVYMEQLMEELQKIENRRRLIAAMVRGEIAYHKRKQDQILADVVSKLRFELANARSIWNGIKVNDLTEEEVQRLEAEHARKKGILDEYSKKTPQQLWMRELLEFLRTYRKHYGEACYDDSFKQRHFREAGYNFDALDMDP